MEENKHDPEEIPVDFPDRSEPLEKAPEPVSSSPYSGKPRTIAELQQFCRSKGMPLEKMRFFIGEDYRAPKAFGIYQSGNEFVVYKNKSDGSRAIRYQGPDEAYAVGELYDKLLDECHMRGIYPERDGAGNSPSYLSSYSSGSYSSRSSYSQGTENSGGKKGCIAFLAICVLFFYRWIIFLIQWIFHLIFFLVVKLINPLVAIAAGVSFFLAKKFFSKEKFSPKVRTAILVGIPLVMILAGQLIRSTGNGYYADHGKKYYKENESWYQSSGSGWKRIDSKPALSADSEYYRSRVDAPIYFSDISNSYTLNERLLNGFYFPEFPSDPGIIDDFFRGGSGSSSTDWDWDSWDSSDTDWDSDW